MLETIFWEAWLRAPKKSSSLQSCHEDLRLEWARIYLKIHFSSVLFTDDTSATLDGRPDGWACGWVHFGDGRYCRLKRQQQALTAMIWAGIIGGDKLLVLFRLPEEFKLLLMPIEFSCRRL